MTDGTAKGTKMTRDQRTGTRSDINIEHNDLSKRISQRVEMLWTDVPYVETPPFPKKMLVEVANICNQKCSFCAYSKMTRPKGVLDFELYKRIIGEAYELGAREIGLHSGSEPLAAKRIVDYVAAAKQVGFSYVYISTNGTLATEERLRNLIDAGLDSLKFSISAADRQAYLDVHGTDDFDKVIANVRFARTYRDERGMKIYLAVSFVECERNRGSFDRLKKLIEPYVDEVFFTAAYNQAGQMDQAPPHQFDMCALPFSQVNISREGYMRLCCNDYQNFLAIEDLHNMSLQEAWNGHQMRMVRNRHLTDNLKGMLCHNCKNGTRDFVSPINSALSDLPQI